MTGLRLGGRGVPICCVTFERLSEARVWLAEGMTLPRIRARSFLLLAAAANRRGAPAAGPDVARFHLGNGLEVVVVPDHRAPVVTHMIWYKVGAADETPGKSGLAHFLEHLMFKGTEKNPGDAFSQDVAAIGGQENAFTASDYTGFFQRVPREHLKEMMALEADRITGLVLTDAVVRPGAERRARRAEHAGRQQSGRRASASRWTPRSISTIPMAGR